MIFFTGKRIFNTLLFSLIFYYAGICQTPADSTQTQKTIASGDDPSQFFTRTEFFSELQHFKKGTTDFYLNQTTVRNIFKIGKRFTTRLDIPFMFNSLPAPEGVARFGLSDISVRLLGYKFTDKPRAAITASIELSLNTAASSYTGTGKNIVLPVVTYTSIAKNKRQLGAVVLQEAYSFSGDKSRKEISFTKVQLIYLRYWSVKAWTVVAPETYFDYVQGGVSMNLEGRMVFAPTQRLNLWLQGGAGMFGEFAMRYQWGTEIGCRYHFLRNTMIKRKGN